MAQCVEIQTGWSNRRKWNYVKNLYMASYNILPNGDYYDSRDVSDVSRVADEAKFTTMFNTDLANWQARGANIEFERFLQWQYEYGTTIYGNLPQHKKVGDHVGHCWAPCPYSNDSDATRSETMLGFTPGTKNDHGIYYMETASNGTEWGFRCTYDDCPYYTATGNRYFYV